MGIYWYLVAGIAVLDLVIVFAILYAHGEREAEREATYIDVRPEE